MIQKLLLIKSICFKVFQKKNILLSELNGSSKEAKFFEVPVNLPFEIKLLYETVLW